jgi:acetoin:2,6-dichlorophenolindophenol oxidoreductase subunit alpha
VTATSRTTPVSVPVCDREPSAEDLYGAVYAIRLFEQSLLDLFGKGVLAGTTHTCLGQEATAVGVLAALDKSRDIVFSNHRGHGHFLAYCGLVEQLYLEVFGKPGGVCGGRGGSQHLHFRNFYSNGIQGGIVPVSTGIALREKIERTGAVTVVFLGDGTLGEGVAYEAFNIASLWSVPVLFVIDDNQYAQSTPKQLQLAGSMPARLAAFGIGVDERETTDAREVVRLARAAADAVRREGRPRGLVLHTYRLGPHSKGDDTRDPAEIRAAWARDPLEVLKPAVPAARRLELERELTEAVTAARESALNAAPYPPRGGR